MELERVDSSDASFHTRNLGLVNLQACREPNLSHADRDARVVQKLAQQWLLRGQFPTAFPSYDRFELSGAAARR